MDKLRNTKNYDYEERIFSGWLTAILGVATCVLFGVFIYQRLIGPVGTRPAPDPVLLVIALVLLFVTVNFATLTIRLTTQGISVGYGIIRHRVNWSNVAECYQDKASTVRYGGFGIRLGLVNGKWRLVYNTISDPRVVVRKRYGKIQEFVFSTRNPEGVMKAIREGIGERG
jgi:hypothetical protein